MHDLSHMRYNFDRRKPFYPIIMAYLMQLHGIKELSAIGILGTNRAWALDGLDATDAERTALQEQTAQKLLGPLSLIVTGDAERLAIPVAFVSQEFVKNHDYLAAHQVQAALNVLVMAHEVTKGKPYRRTDDEKWEFLRHCRHAAAHNGRWHFLNKEPRRPASWRGIELRKDMHDRRLLKGPNGDGSLNLGDPVALLWELERYNPLMQP